MVDWNDPETIMTQAETLLKLVHVMDGIYIWEFVSTSGYEWRILRGQQQWKWILWLYVGCRLFTFAEVVTDLTGFNITSPINCKLWITFLFTFSYLASSLALSLYGLRTIAIWKRNIVIVVFIALISSANIGLWIYAITKSDAEWNPLMMSCMVMQTNKALPSTLGTLATNGLILITMVIGILRTRPQPGALIHLFWREGVFWLLIATVVQVLPSTFVALNLNDSMNLMFQTPALICSTIGATRIYRGITERNMGDVLEYWESSVDATTGELKFHRRMDPVSSGPAAAVPLGRVRLNDGRFVERFDAREIKLNGDDSDSAGTDAKIDKPPMSPLTPSPL